MSRARHVVLIIARRGAPIQRHYVKRHIGYAKMAECGVSFPELGRRPAEQPGEPIERTVLFNKVKRGSFSATFLMEVLGALGLDPEWTKEVEDYLPSSPGQGG